MLGARVTPVQGILVVTPCTCLAPFQGRLTCVMRGNRGAGDEGLLGGGAPALSCQRAAKGTGSRGSRRATFFVSCQEKRP